MSIGAELANSQFKIAKIQWRGLNPSNLSSGHASVGEGNGEDGRKCRKRNKGEVECLFAAGTCDRLSVNAQQVYQQPYVSCFPVAGCRYQLLVPETG